MSVRVTKVLLRLLPAPDSETAIERMQRLASGDTRGPGMHRMASFDRGDEPLRACSSLPPRLTGWEREWQH